MEMTEVCEVYVAKHADDANRMLKGSDWKLLSLSVGVRNVYHSATTEGEQPYNFEVPYTLFVLGRVN